MSWGAMPGTPAATAYGLKHLPHDLLGQRIALHPAAAVDGLENVAIHHVGGTGREVSMATLTRAGTGTVRMRPCLPIRSTMQHRPSRR